MQRSKTESFFDTGSLCSPTAFMICFCCQPQLAHVSRQDSPIFPLSVPAIFRPQLLRVSTRKQQRLTRHPALEMLGVNQHHGPPNGCKQFANRNRTFKIGNKLGSTNDSIRKNPFLRKVLKYLYFLFELSKHF